MKKPDSTGFRISVHYIIIVILLYFCYTSSAKAQDTACSQSPPPEHSISLIPIGGESDSPTLPSTACQNSDFSLGTFTNWSGCSGKWCADTLPTSTRCTSPYIPFNPPCNNPGQPWHNTPTGGHFSIQNPGQDPCISALSKVFTGEAHSALIGNRVCTSNNAGGYVDQLTYQITYDTNNSFFIYRCAVVLANITDPTHNTANRRPRFTFEIKDHVTGNLIDTACGFYDLWPGDGITVWQNGPNTYVWKDWSTIGVDFNALSGVTAGQILDVVFTVHGCGFTAHTGYAYISAFCGSMTIQVAGCEGSGEVTLTGPPGFTQYEWQGPYCPTCPPNPPTYFGNPITLTTSQGAVSGNYFTLTLTALNGCQVQNIQQIIAFTNVTAGFTHDSACVGQGMQFNDQSTTNQNQINAWDWDFGDGTSIVHTQNPVHIYTAANTYTVSLTAHSSDSCTNTTTSQITVDTLPALTNNPLSKKICSRTNTNILLTSDRVGTTFTWTATSNSPLVTGWSNNTTNPTTVINQTLTNTDTKIDTVTYYITPHLTECDGLVTNYKVAVAPLPILTNTVLSKSICDSTSTNILLLSNNDSTLFTWTCIASSLNLSGYSNNTTIPGILINQVIYNSGFSIDTVTYHIVPHSFGCLGDTSKYKVIVFPFPDLSNIPLTKSICNNTSLNITLTSHVPGTLFTWTCTPSSGNLGGFSNNSIPTTILNQTLFNSGFTVETVTYNIVPQANGCTGYSSNFVVTVNPVPNLSNTPTSEQLCNNTSTNLTLTSNVAGTLFTWTTTGSSGNVSGFSDNPIPTTILNQTLTNSGFNIETVTYHIMPHANGCDGNIIDYIVTVYPVADVYFTPPAQTVCSGVTSNIQIFSHVAGATFAWTASGSSPNVSGFSPDNGNAIQQTLSNTGYSIETVNYAVTPVANGCTGTLNHVIITVNPPPVVSLTSCWDPVTTTDAQPFNLKGGVPLGGTYSGVGVNTGFFYPGIAGVGGHTISYSYVNSFGCTRNANQTITVMAPLAFACGNPVTDVRDNQQYATVMINTQCWMAANLNFGNTILSSQMQRDNCISEKYCFSDIPANCANTGGLYQWDEMMKFDNTNGAQGFCPPGWHIPTEADWGILFNFYTSNGFAGNPLKLTGYSGFNALLSGVRHENVTWSFNNFSIMLWSSTAHGTNKAWAHGMNTFNPSVSYYPSLRSNAFSVRCLKD